MQNLEHMCFFYKEGPSDSQRPLAQKYRATALEVCEKTKDVHTSFFVHQKLNLTQKPMVINLQCSHTLKRFVLSLNA